ncbi:uncharacterized protein CFP56_002619 [Quercus suber]|uniref:Zinc knuckle CX2CX4HX4C domain-containing protein n=1 Tax=Quercus suber TaxID=58331 RepID=A0AAW0IKX0_QUESU
MAEELEELWKKLTFTEEEGVGIVLDSSSTRAAKEVGNFCVVIKILTQRSINLEVVRKNIRMLWKPNKGVKISEIDEDLFLVEFGDGKDKKKCKTKETGWVIGSSLGLVLDVDVPESRVQWSKCLRVRVRIDVTKRLVRGKKITIEGGESIWVSFKFERLPNFCYRCGLLNHALKDCNKGFKLSKNEGENVLQYGAWLRGDPLR